MTDEEQSRKLVRAYLYTQSGRLQASLTKALAEPIVLEAGHHIQFEVCPSYQGIHLCATDAEIMEDDWLLGGLVDDLSDDELEAAMVVVNEMVIEWLAEGWHRVGGPRLYSPALAFLNGYSDQFDLEQRRWLSMDEASNA